MKIQVEIFLNEILSKKFDFVAQNKNVMESYIYSYN